MIDLSYTALIHCKLVQRGEAPVHFQRLCDLGIIKSEPPFAHLRTRSLPYLYMYVLREGKRGLSVAIWYLICHSIRLVKQLHWAWEGEVPFYGNCNQWRLNLIVEPLYVLIKSQLKHDDSMLTSAVAIIEET